MAYANRLINKLFLYKYHFRTANRFAAILSYFYIIRAVSYIVLIKGKLVTVIALRHIGHFETADAALLIQLYRKQIKNCPYESGSSRSDMKEVLSRLEAINPEARYSLWSSMSNIQEDYLPKIINHKS